MLQCVAAVALVPVLQTGEAVVVFVAECLAGLDGHGGEVDVGYRVERAGVGFICAAQIGPGVGRLAGDRHPCGGRGGGSCCCPAGGS